MLIQHCYLITGRPHSSIAISSSNVLTTKGPSSQTWVAVSGLVSRPSIWSCISVIPWLLLPPYENDRPVILKTVSQFGFWCFLMNQFRLYTFARNPRLFQCIFFVAPVPCAPVLINLMKLLHVSFFPLCKSGIYWEAFWDYVNILFFLKPSIYFIYICHCGLMFSCFTQWVRMCDFPYLFWCSDCPEMASSASSFFEHFLTFWHKKMLHIHLFLPCLPWN